MHIADAERQGQAQGESYDPLSKPATATVPRHMQSKQSHQVAGEASGQLTVSRPCSGLGSPPQPPPPPLPLGQANCLSVEPRLESLPRVNALDLGGQDAGRAFLRSHTGVQRRGQGRRDRPITTKGKPHRLVRAADRRPGTHRPVVQLPQARGRAHRRRAGVAHGVRSAGHPQLRPRSPSTRSRSSCTSSVSG